MLGLEGLGFRAKGIGSKVEDLMLRV